MYVLEVGDGGEDSSVDRSEDGRWQRRSARLADVRTEAPDGPPEDGEEKAEEKAVLQRWIHLAEDSLRADGTLSQERIISIEIIEGWDDG